jgi:DNA helicase HerA-like ATPase
MMLHRMQRIVKIGRNFGIGVSFLSPRPQEISKKALNGCQTVLAFRLTGPQERKAMKDWIAAHDIDQSVIEKLPSLETGTCHVWSPAFLKVSQQIRILPKSTFDASATPKVGERRAARELAPIDLAKIKDEMAGDDREGEGWTTRRRCAIGARSSR